METKALAFITALQSHETKFHVPARIYFLTGERKGKEAVYEVTTDIFRYYYFGVTLEVVEFDKIGNIINIHDVDSSDFNCFNLNLLNVYSFNLNTTEMLCSNGFVYIFNQSTFWRNYNFVCQNIISNMQVAYNFVMYAFTMNNTLLYTNVEFNLKETDKRFKRAIQRGFITSDKKLLKMMSPVTQTTKDPDAIMKQEEIDKLVSEMLGEN